MSTNVTDYWNPYTKYTWTKKEINQWVGVFGAWAFYNGEIYYIKTKKIADSSYYTVSFSRNN